MEPETKIEQVVGEAGGDMIVGPGIPADQVAALVALKREEDRLAAELSSVRNQARGVAEALLERFLEAGVRQVKAEDGATVFINRRAFYSVVERDGEMKSEATARVAAALEEAGLGHLVSRPTVIDLGAVATEIDDLSDLDPAALVGETPAKKTAELLTGLFKVAEQFDLKVRRR